MSSRTKLLPWFPQDLAAALEAFSNGGYLAQEFTDRHFVERDLKWSLTGFDAALKDYHPQSNWLGLL